MEERLVNQTFTSFDEEEQTLRPQRLNEYVGQSELKEMLDIYITTAKKRKESLDHQDLVKQLWHMLLRMRWEQK